MAEVKSLSKVQEKWTRVTPQRSEDYRLGVESPRRDWATTAVAAKESHKAAMVAAGSSDAYAKGIAKAGTGKWKSKALAKGPGRFSEGVMVGGEDYGKGVAPYLEAIASVVMPPRFPRRDPRNNARVLAIDNALSKKKTGATA
jgi:hypothetical protein